MTIAIIGTGNMGRGIATRFIAGGQRPTLYSAEREQAAELGTELGLPVAGSIDEALSADIVVLATPYAASLELAREYAAQLAGKTVIDISNPLNASYDGLVTEPGTSAAEQISAAAPGARVVKAFNTTFAGTLVSGQVRGQALDVLLASDDEDAKVRVAGLVEAGGLVPIDAGPLHRAQQLEALGLLGVTLQFRLGTQFGTTWKLVRP